MKKLISILAALVVSVALVACSGGMAENVKIYSDAPGYYEIANENRIYVVGDETIAKNYHGGDLHLPYTRTLIGQGPKGETVVIEVQKKKPEYADRLEETFRAKNLPYAEFQHDGRFYVAGTEKGIAGFSKTYHFPYTKTFIGAGPGNKTVIVEVDKKNPHMVYRLQWAFEDRHSVALN